MATRKDNKGRLLQKGEFQRKDGRYVYQFRDPLYKMHQVYAATLPELRMKEESLKRDQLDGIALYATGKITLNELFDRFIVTKRNLRSTTRHNYEYMYNKYVRETFGKRYIPDIKYSDVKYFYELFRREFGAAPGEYRKNAGNSEV